MPMVASFSQIIVPLSNKLLTNFFLLVEQRTFNLRRRENLMPTEQRTAWKEASWIFLLSRLTIVVFSYLGVTFLHVHDPGTLASSYIVLETCSSHLNCFLLSWWRWDAIHYVEIAYLGYAHHVSLSAFFPLFPLLIRALGTLFGGSIMADYATGILLANVCFYGVLVLFYHLVSKDYGHTVARYALIYLAFNPYGIFFFVGYTESLSLLLSLAAFIFLRRGRVLDWWLAGLCGCLAALTRPTGIILLVPFLVLFVQRFGIRTIFTRRDWWQKLNAMLAMALVPAGLLIYVGYLWITFGDPWVFHLEEVAIWQRYTAFPWVGPFDAIKTIKSGRFLNRQDITDLAFTFAPLAVLIVGWKRLPLDYSLFSAAMALFVLCQPCQFEPLMSVPRYLLIIFSIIVILSLWSKHNHITWQLMIPFILLFIANIMQLTIYNWVA
jgi:hypothetical protein